MFTISRMYFNVTLKWWFAISILEYNRNYCMLVSCTFLDFSIYFSRRQYCSSQLESQGVYTSFFPLVLVHQVVCKLGHICLSFEIVDLIRLIKLCHNYLICSQNSSSAPEELHLCLQCKVAHIVVCHFGQLQDCL